MAKKKEELSYLQMPLPSGQSTKRSVRLDWSGLNYRKKTGTGVLSYEKNISTREAPCLTPSGTFREVYSFGEIPHMETIDISVQGDYKVENGMLVLDDGIKRNLAGIPPAYSGTVIIPESLTDDSNNRIHLGFFAAKNATLFVVKTAYKTLDVCKRDSNIPYKILFTSGVTRIESCYAVDSDGPGRCPPNEIWIPKTVTSIAYKAFPQNVKICYEGTEAEWSRVSLSSNKYWKYAGEVIFNSTGLSFDPEDYQSATEQTFTDSTLDNAAEHFTIENYVLKAYSGTAKRIKVPEGVAKIAYEFAETASGIEEIHFPSTVTDFTVSEAYESLKSVSVYQSTSQTGTASIGVGHEKCYYITGHGAELAAIIGYTSSAGGYDGSSQLDIFDANNVRLKGGSLLVSSNLYLNDPKPYKILFFSKFSGDIASTKKDNTTEQLLIYPDNKSATMFSVVRIPYRYEYLGGGRIYPWTFLKDFVDTNCVYYVYERQGGHKVPERSTLRYQDTYYEFSDYCSERVEDILGYWYYHTDDKHWTKLDGEPTIETPATFSTTDNPCPELEDATVFQSRIFGIDNGKVFVSAFNDYSKWTLDTANSSSSSNAWITALNSNSGEYGKLTAITAYQDRVIVFRERYMYEIRNTKNPFRVVDIFQEGCIGRDALCIVGGYLFFASENGIMVYTGAKPKSISEPLGINRIFYATMGTDGRNLFVYCMTDQNTHNIFVYDTLYGTWSEMAWDQKVLCFTNNDNGLYMLCEDNKIYHYEDREYSADWAAETDMSLAGTVDIKHLKKIQLYAEMSPGSKLSVILIQANEDGSTTELPVCEERNLDSGTKTIPIRVIPRKTASHGYKVRFEGSGYVKLYQMELTLSGGGELYG